MSQYIHYFLILTISLIITKNGLGQGQKYTLLAQKIQNKLDSIPKESKQFIDLYREWATQEKNSKEIAQSWLFEGDMLYLTGEIIPSTNAYLKATDINKKDQKLDSLTTYGYIYAAYNYNELNLFDECKKALTLGLPYAKLLKDSTYLADYYSNLGGAFFHTGDLGKAVTYFDSCLMVEKSLRDTLGMLKVINNIGKINLRNNQSLKAISYYEDALMLAERIDISNNLESIILTNLGYAYLKNDQIDKAKKVFAQSYKINKETSDTLQMINTLLSLSEVSMQEKKYKEGNDHINNALGLINDKIAPIMVANVFNSKGQILTKLNQLNDAKHHFNEALEVSKKHSILLKQKVAIKGLIEVSKLQGNYKKASLLAEDLILIQDQIIKKENSKAIEEINAQYKYEKQIMEIQSLEDKNAINSLKIKNLRNQRIWLAILSVLLLLMAGLIAKIISNRYKLKLKEKEAKIRQQQKEIDDIQAIVSVQLADQELNANHLLSHDEVNSMLQTHLTVREYEILVETYNGLSNKEIATKLFLSINTIKFHLKNVYLKLDVSNRIQALKAVTR